ncbi:MAG TPA: IPT/TIG domain-containing protein [Candidatus Dormibacteraeota bacterium]|nr:IPT/TIG domain-containing protein [Candidatus Dormibacteraeota bacterium]
MKIAKTVLLTALLAAGLACGGYNSNSTQNTPPGPGTMPNITALAPNSANSPGAAFVLTVNGTNFNTTATINWNAAAQATTKYVSTNQLTVTIPASDVATPGTATVTVTNPAVAGGRYGGGTLAETSNSMTFTIN